MKEGKAVNYHPPYARQGKALACIVTTILVLKFLLYWLACAMNLMLARLHLYVQVVCHAQTREIMMRLRLQYRRTPNPLDGETDTTYTPGSAIALLYQEGAISRAEADIFTVLRTLKTPEEHHEHQQ